MQALRFLAIALLLAPGLAHPDWIAGWYHVTIYIDVECQLGHPYSGLPFFMSRSLTMNIGFVSLGETGRLLADHPGGDFSQVPASSSNWDAVRRSYYSLVEITTTEEVVGSVYPLVDECCKLYWRQDLWIYQQANHIILGSTRARLDCSKCANTFDPSIVNCAAIKPVLSLSPTIEWQKYL